MTELPPPDDASDDRPIVDSPYSRPLRPGIAPLKRYFLVAFSATEMRHFIREHYPAVEHALPGPEATGEAVVSEAAVALERRGLVDTALFRRLQAARPQRRPELLECAAAWQIPADAVPPVPLDAPAPPQPDPPNKPRWFSFDLRIRSFRLLIILLIPLVSLPVILRIREVPPEPRELPSDVEPPVQPLQDWPPLPYRVPLENFQPQSPFIGILMTPEGSQALQPVDAALLLEDIIRTDDTSDPRSSDKYAARLLEVAWKCASRQPGPIRGPMNVTMDNDMQVHVSGSQLPDLQATLVESCIERVFENDSIRALNHRPINAEDIQMTEIHLINEWLKGPF